MNMQSTKNNSLFLKVFETVVCLYIVIVPLANSIKDFAFFGYGLHVWISAFLIILTIVSVVIEPKSNLYRIGFPYSIAVIFILEIFYMAFTNSAFEIGIFLNVLLYISFLIMPKTLSLKKIYTAYYIAAVIAAIFTISGGSATAGEVTRTATLVDGSISLVVILIVFFAKEPFEKTTLYVVLKSIAVPCGFIISAYGMSRSRIAILLFLIMIKVFMLAKNVLKTGTVKTNSVFLFPVLLILVVILFNMDITQNLIGEINERFSSGFESLGRDDEITTGLLLFKEHPLIGSGWGSLFFRDYQNYYSTYYNHCMYIAILARGGILMAIPFFLSFLSILRKTILQKNFFCFCALSVFFLLGYGNAGLFNYTICGMMIPIIICLNFNFENTYP